MLVAISVSWRFEELAVLLECLKTLSPGLWETLVICNAAAIPSISADIIKHTPVSAIVPGFDAYASDAIRNQHKRIQPTMLLFEGLRAAAERSEPTLFLEADVITLDPVLLHRHALTIPADAVWARNFPPSGKNPQGSLVPAPMIIGCDAARKMLDIVPRFDGRAFEGILMQLVIDAKVRLLTEPAEDNRSADAVCSLRTTHQHNVALLGPHLSKYRDMFPAGITTAVIDGKPITRMWNGRVLTSDIGWEG